MAKESMKKEQEEEMGQERKLTKKQLDQESLFYVDVLTQGIGQKQEDGSIMVCSDDDAEEDADEYDYEPVNDMEKITTDLLTRKGALINQTN